MNSDLTLSLHWQAQDLLFGNFQMLRRIFHNVLGHLEVDYLSITLHNSKNQILFLSSHPAIEQNLIEQNLWPHDPCFSDEFYKRNKFLLWNEVYANFPDLEHYKLHQQGLSFGLSMPHVVEKIKANYSFGLKSKNSKIQNQLLENNETLVSMSRYCLRKIAEDINLDEFKKLWDPKPVLKLIINRN